MSFSFLLGMWGPARTQLKTRFPLFHQITRWQLQLGISKEKPPELDRTSESLSDSRVEQSEKARLREGRQAAGVLPPRGSGPGAGLQLWRVCREL